MKYIKSSGKHNGYRIITLCLLLLLNLTGLSQKEISDRKKIRYLKKVESKNEQYVKQQEKKTRSLLNELSRKERALFEKVDSFTLDSSILKTSFSKISDRLDEGLNSNPNILAERLSQPANVEKSISISCNISGDLRNYLKQQFLTSAFFADSSCTSCAKLRKQSDKTKQSISKTSEKLERLKSIQEDIKKHQKTLNNYGVNTPEFAKKIKDINKSCYYYTQNVNGFKDLYTNPTAGIEKSLLKNLSFNKDFKIFQSQFTPLPVSLPSLSNAVAPDMTGYQTKAQVQAMLPQNAAGISPDVKSQLLSNMQSTLTKFAELRDEKPDLTILKEKPDFKVNPYKGLPIQKRLIPGFIFQPQTKKINEPFIIDLGGSLGFKLTKRLTPLVGVSTKVGMGKDIHHPQCTYQGFVAKVGFDTKLVYGFSVQTWYESTWRPLPDKLMEDNIVNRPQPSLIAGLCNSYTISKSVKGTLMIGYDFFNYQHTPYKSPWVIRMGLQ